MFTARTLPDGSIVTTHYAEAPETLPEGEVAVAIPTDEVTLHFRSAWELGPEGIRVNLAKAKAQRTALIRQMIDERLAAIDVRAARAVREALITGDKSRVQQLETDAAALRSVRSNTGVDTIANIEALAAYLPAILMGN